MTKNPESLKPCSASAEIIGGNEDLLSKIFLYLPVRHLTQFKSVSKQWCALISDPEFGLTHTLENPRSGIPTGLLLCSNPFYNCIHSVYSISLSKFGGKIPSCSDSVELPDEVPIKLMQPLPVESMMLVQSCNGLNLFRLQSFLISNIKFYCVHNLATNKLRTVPLPNLDAYIGESIVTCSLAFDPLVSPHYKVIFIIERKCFNSFKIVIFSSETGQWKYANVNIGKCWLSQLSRGVYCNGSIYWVSNDSPDSYCYRFDIESESWTTISIPENASSVYFPFFGEFAGHLYLVSDCNIGTTEMLDVFELDQVTKKWFIKYQVHLNCLISSFPQVVASGRYNTSPYSFSVLSVVSGEKEDESSLVMTIPGKIVSYNFKSKKVEVVSEIRSEETIGCSSATDIRWEDDMDSFGCSSATDIYPHAYPLIATLYPL